MRMKRLVPSIVFLGILFAHTGTGAAEQVYRKSLGIKLYNFNNFGVAYRRWKNDKKGSEFSINYIYTSLNRDNKDQISISMPRIGYDILSRRPILERMYFVRGIGLESGVYYSKYASDNYYLYVKGIVRLPIGIEHFFLGKYPNISYSLHTDLYGGVGYTLDQYPSGKNRYFNFEVGITPSVALRIYFK